ncbi:MAG: 2-oxo acid dehydrogenase subunit E2 [Gammaproteobacteria bacterium]|nr:2-oxo acid dehydrogenase subunit E2 [Gammaproteobacteria bacterium]NND60356.1 2-oxo acid dehydrogenase subunit E2 [Gammaproteobacteria bacterium]
MSTFNLPDLGEGLPEAEIVTWHVAEGDTVKVDQPLVSVETAKAVVEVPSPQSGVIAKLYAPEGGIVETGKPLVDFADGSAPRMTAAADTAEQPQPQKEAAGGDSGTVVGSMPTSDEVTVETAVAGGSRRRRRGRVKATPAVRMMAKRHGVDLARVEPSGNHGQVTPADLQGFVDSGDSAAAPAARPATPPPPPRTDIDFGTAQPLRGPRRAMAQSMSASRDQVTQCTLFDDADIHDWARGQDITTRIVRAIVAGCRAEPGLNAWFDGENNSRVMHEHIDLAMAVDTPDGLIVPVLRDVGNKNSTQLRAAVNDIKVATRNRTVSPADMKDPTITLSNFGMMAGRYATPVIVPPMVTILGTGGLRHDVVAVMGGIEVHKRIPLSLTFDHRCITGGEACRFLAAVIDDLRKPD